MAMRRNLEIGIPFWASRAVSPQRGVAGTEKRVSLFCRCNTIRVPAGEAAVAAQYQLRPGNAFHIQSWDRQFAASLPDIRPAPAPVRHVAPAATAILLHSGPPRPFTATCPVMCKMRNVQTRPNCHLAQPWPYQSSPSCCSHKGQQVRVLCRFGRGDSQVAGWWGEAGMHRLVFSLFAAENIRQVLLWTVHSLK